ADRVVGERAAPLGGALLLLLCVTVTLDQIVTDVVPGLPGEPRDSEDSSAADVVHDEVLLFCVLVESGDEPPARGACLVVRSPSPGRFILRLRRASRRRARCGRT